jgi:thiamine kinase-like enzyme
MLENVVNKHLIRENLRFAIYNGELNGARVFIKTAAKPDLEKAIAVEAAGLQAMYELDPAESHYSTTRVLGITNDSLMTSWAEGSSMVEDFTKATAEQHIDTLLDLFSYIDSRTSSGSGVTRFNQPGRENGVDEMLRRLKALDYQKHIDASLVEKTAEYARQHLTTTETRFTHGDLQPGNILIRPNEVPVVIDCESCSWLWPRHYNLVNFAFNYGPRHDTWLPKKLYTAFFAYFDMLQIDPKSMVDQINFSAAMRAMQSINELLGGHTEAGRDRLPENVRDYLIACMENIIQGRLFVEVFKDSNTG